MEKYAQIINPKNNSVTQRNSNNIASILIEILYSCPVKKIRIKFKNNKITTEWHYLELYYNKAIGSIDLVAGEWYTLILDVLDNDNNILEQQTVEKIGVGDVYITSGQSNSINFGEQTTKSNTGYVVSYDPHTLSWQPSCDPQPSELGPKFDLGEGGSVWPTVGDILYEKLQMPIGFISTGWGGSSIEDFKYETEKYKRILNALNFVGKNGTRAVLWHQGETDAVLNHDTEWYLNNLYILIENIRKDIKWEVNWIIAKASYHPTATLNGMKKITLAQEKICNGTSIIQGPNTDVLMEEYRIKNSAHFTLHGLKTHGKLWAEILLDDHLF